MIDGPRLFRELSERLEATARRWEFSPATLSERTATLEFLFEIVEETAPDEHSGVAFRPPYRIEVRSKPYIIDVTPHHDPKGTIGR